MRIFIYEFVTGGGWYHVEQAKPPATLLTEGAAMLRAIVADFAAINDVEVCLQADARFEQEFSEPNISVRTVNSRDEELLAFSQLAASADAVMLIAPEFSRHLHQRAQLIEDLGVKLLSPAAKFISVTGDKWCTHLLLAKAGVPVPHSLLLQRGVSLPSFMVFPVVIKPVDGCGSIGVQKLSSPTDKIDWSDLREPEIIAQAFRPGQPASIAILCGSNRNICLPGGRQHLSQEGRFRYLGGELPLSRSLQARAETLAIATLAALPATVGYVGIDIILGETAEADCVIEVNPRLTTSYVGLRALCETNLAQAMLDLAAGLEPNLKFKPSAIHFLANGTLD